MTSVFRAVGCTRVSSRRQAKEGFSLEEQAANIRAYCEREGVYLVEILEDRAKTGRILERPAIVRMLELADAKAFEVLVMCKIDRAGRRNRVIQEIIGEAQDRGIRVHFLEGGAGDTAEGRLVLNVLGGLAEYNWEQLRASTMAARRRKAMSGRIPGRLNLFGYHQITRAEATVKPECAGRDGLLEIVSEEAEWVREVFLRYDLGLTLSGLATYLNEAGIRTRANGLWRGTSIRETLSNSAYVGTWVWGRNEYRQMQELTEGGNPRFQVSPANPDRQVLIPVPPILTTPEGEPDLALFQRVQRRLQDSYDAFRGRPTILWPLSGLVFCGSCVTQDGRPRRCRGERVSHTQKRPGYLYRRYVCNAGTVVSAEPCNTAYNAGELEEQVRSHLLGLTEPGELQRRIRAQIEAHAATVQDTTAELERLRAELLRLDDAERKVIDLALKGLSEHLLGEKIAEIKRDRVRATVRLRALEGQAAPVRDLEALDQQAALAAKRIRGILTEGDVAAQQQVYRALVSVTIWRNQEPAVSIQVDAALGFALRNAPPTSGD